MVWKRTERYGDGDDDAVTSARSGSWVLLACCWGEKIRNTPLELFVAFVFEVGGRCGCVEKV